METLPVPIKLLLSLLLGAFIGLERESYERAQERGGVFLPKKIPGIGLGVRTFSLITLLGSISGLLYRIDFSLFLLLNITFMALVLSSYILSSLFSKDIGMTTEIAIIFSFVIGICLAIDAFPIQLIVAITIILVLILSQKQNVRLLVSELERNEVTNFISYAIIALVILPFLPNRWFTIADFPILTSILTRYDVHSDILLKIELINPFFLWFAIALITGIDVVGYVFGKILGDFKGWILTSFIGGFISSTALTQVLAMKSNISPKAHYLISAAMFAFLASYIQHYFVIAAMNPILLGKSTVMIITVIIISLIIGLIHFTHVQKSEKIQLDHKNLKHKEMKLFSLKPAVQFAFLFLIINIIIKISFLYLGNIGFLLTTSLAAFTGMDFVILSISQLAGKTLSYETAITALIIANAVNLFARIFYCSFQGTKEFLKNITIAYIIIILSSVIGLIQ